MPLAINSGFFLESTVGVEEILFDLAVTSPLDPFASSLEIGADLLVSPEFDAILDAGVAGVDVGDALVQATAAAIPEPTSLGFLMLAGSTFLVRRRRS